MTYKETDHRGVAKNGKSPGPRKLVGMSSTNAIGTCVSSLLITVGSSDATSVVGCCLEAHGMTASEM